MNISFFLMKCTEITGFVLTNAEIDAIFSTFPLCYHNIATHFAQDILQEGIWTVIGSLIKKGNLQIS